MYHNSIPDYMRDKIKSLGLLPMITGIRTALNNELVIVDYKAFSNSVKLVFGVDNGLMVLVFEVTNINDPSNTKYQLGSPQTRYSSKQYSSMIETSNFKYLLNKLKKSHHHDIKQLIRSINESMSSSVRVFREQLTQRLSELPQYKQKYISCESSIGECFARVYKGDLEMQSISDETRDSLETIYKTVVANKKAKDALKADKEAVFSGDKYIWIRTNSGRIMAGVADADDNYTVPLQLYHTADDVPQDIRDPVLARLTMASVLRCKTTNHNEFFDENKLYPCFDWAWHNDNKGIELNGVLETYMHSHRGDDALVYFINKK